MAAAAAQADASSSGASCSGASSSNAAGAGGRAHPKQPGKLPRTRMVRIKIVSLGDCGVGKSCLIKR
jgi:hypothetical protein